MHDVYLGLGSNLGDREAMLREALAAINQLPGTTLKKQSPIYETPPMGPQDQDAYLNMAAWITTSLDALGLMRALQQIESRLGRANQEQRQHWGPREIDIDILLFGSEVIQQESLIVPHPGMHERWFVLKPLSDLAPEVVHPIAGKRIQELLDVLDQAAAKEASP